MNFRISRTMENGEIFTAKLRLDDRNGNGHDDFSITGEIKKGRRIESCGCLQDEMLKVFPELDFMIALHCSDSKGYPMYFIGNGYYYAKNESLATFMEHMRVTREEAIFLIKSKDKAAFCKSVIELGMVARWKADAERGIEFMEKNCKETYIRRDVEGHSNKLFTTILKELN